MLGGGIPLMMRESISGISPIHATHEAVPKMLGHQAGARNLIKTLVALDVGFLRDLDGGNLSRIYQHQVWTRRQARHGAPHRLQRRPVDVDAIDFTGTRNADRGADRFVEDGVGQLRADIRIQHLLGIVHAANSRFLGHDHRRGHHRPGQWSNAHFVHSGQRAYTAREIRRFPAAEAPHHRNFAGLFGCASCLVAHDRAS